MREIITQKGAQDVSRLGFCYICGEDFANDEKRTRDHVPPKSIFRKEDRDWPLTLPAHEKCNSDYSTVDQQARGLIGLLHPERPREAVAGTKIVGGELKVSGTFFHSSACMWEIEIGDTIRISPFVLRNFASPLTLNCSADRLDTSTPPSLRSGSPGSTGPLRGATAWAAGARLGASVSWCRTI